mmetsp:Transcript_36333/g.56774  ORF Transcript_36333/g.56774 Transcript_36333/m.56774 type:complete len:125 (-) Transcript_36333:658-1032(-)
MQAMQAMQASKGYCPSAATSPAEQFGSITLNFNYMRDLSNNCVCSLPKMNLCDVCLFHVAQFFVVPHEDDSDQGSASNCGEGDNLSVVVEPVALGPKVGVVPQTHEHASNESSQMCRHINTDRE